MRDISAIVPTAKLEPLACDLKPDLRKVKDFTESLGTETRASRGEVEDPGSAG